MVNAKRINPLEVVLALALFVTIVSVSNVLATPAEAANEQSTFATESNLEGDDAWYTWHAKPGDTIDVTEADRDTTVLIDQEGTYRLTGNSTHARVEVSTKGKDITIELADGLSIKPNATANIDDHSSAIDISDEGGTVTLVSDSGANIYFGGYLSAPAICKSETSTQLVFETKDPQ